MEKSGYPSNHHSCVYVLIIWTWKFYVYNSNVGRRNKRAAVPVETLLMDVLNPGLLLKIGRLKNASRRSIKHTSSPHV